MHYSGFSIVMYGETKLAVSQERKRKSKIPKYFCHELRVRVKSRLEMLPTVLNIKLDYLNLSFFKVPRKIVRNRAVSSYRRVCM